MPPGYGKVLQIALANECSQTAVDGPLGPTFHLWSKTEKQVYYPSLETYGSSDLDLHSSVNEYICDDLQHHEAEHSQERERGSNQSSNEIKHSPGNERYTFDIMKTERSLRKKIVAVDDATEHSQDRGSISDPSLLEDEKFSVNITFKNFKTDGRIQEQFVVSKYPTAKREFVEGLLEFKIDLEPFESDIREDLKTISFFSVPPQLKNESHNGMYKVAEVDSNAVCAKQTQVLDKPPKKQVSERLVTAKLKAHHIASELGHEPAVTLRRKLNMISQQLLSKHTSEMEELTDRTKGCYSNKLTWELYQLAEAGLTHLKCLALEIIHSNEEQTVEELKAGAYQHVCRLLVEREKEVQEYEWVALVLDSDFGAHQCAPGKERTSKRKGGGQSTDSRQPPPCKRSRMTQHDVDDYRSESTHSTASAPRSGDNDHRGYSLIFCNEDSSVVTNTPRGSFLACKDIDKRLVDDKKRTLGQLHSRGEHGLTFNGHIAELYCRMPNSVRLSFETHFPPIKMRKEEIDNSEDRMKHISLRMEFVQRVEGIIKFMWTGFQKPVRFDWPIPQSMHMIIPSNGNPFSSSQLEGSSVPSDLLPQQMTPQATHMQTTHQPTPSSHNGVECASPLTSRPTHCAIFHERPTLLEFLSLCWEDGDISREIRIMDEVSSRWRYVGIALGFSGSELDTIEEARLRKPDNCIQNVFTDWLRKFKNCNWNGLITALRRAGFPDLAIRVTNALPHKV